MVLCTNLNLKQNNLIDTRSKIGVKLPSFLMDGTVYVLTNPAMPDLVKIGKTTRDVSLRLSDLYTTGVPLPFEVNMLQKLKTSTKLKRLFILGLKKTE